MYSFSTLFPFIGNRDKLWLSEEIFTIFVILGRMVYCHGKCLVRVLLGGGFRSGVECFSVHMRSMQIWDLQSARKRLGAIFLSERVLGQLFLRVLELRVLKKNKTHARTSCDNLTSFRERIKLWKRKKSHFSIKRRSKYILHQCVLWEFFFS